MKKAALPLLILAFLICSCQKQTCRNCPHGSSSPYVVTVCTDNWGAAPGGGYQTPSGQTYVNYTNCY